MKHLLTTLKLSVSGQEANREIMGVTLTVAIRLSSVSVRPTGLSRSGPFIPGRPRYSLSPTKGPPRSSSSEASASPLPPPLLLPNLHPCLLLFLESPQCLTHSFQPLTSTSVFSTFIGLFLPTICAILGLAMHSPQTINQAAFFALFVFLWIQDGQTTVCRPHRGPLIVLVNKVLLEYRHIHSFTCNRWLLLRY